ncbi:hypothetical protein SprV_0200893300 [Sparganum proliferum]
MEEKFSSMECCNYVYDENNPENTSENPYCCCGESKALHADASKGLEKSEFTQARKPTRAYGILKFWLKGFANISTNYLRLCSKDHIESVVELLVKYWKLIPEDQDVVCISFIGSALDEVGEIAFRPIEQALIETARTMNIIVIANGADNALTRNIGRILTNVKRMLAVTKENNRPPRFLGIMPWSNVCEKEKLNCRGGEVVLNSRAACDPYTQLISPFLTDLLLIDNGRREKPEVLTCNDFRWRLESKICARKNNRTVCLLWNGSVGSIVEAESRINRLIPVIILHRTGGAADVITKAKQFKSEYSEFDDFDPEHMIELYEQLRSLHEDMGIEDAYDDLKRLFINEKILFTYDMRSKVPFIKTLFDAFAKYTFTAADFFEFSLKWDRDEGVLNLGSAYLSTIPQARRNQLFTLALLQARHKFIQPLVDIGIQPHEIVTAQFLKDLYNDCSLSVNVSRLLYQAGQVKPRLSTNVQRADSHYNSFEMSEENIPAGEERTSVALPLQDIHAYLYGALGGFYCPQYFQTPKIFLDQDDDQPTLSNPLMHIFIWSILTNCHEMAIALLKVSPSPVASALIGAALNRHHAALLPTYDTFTRARLEEQAAYFEQVASEVLMEVDSVDRELAIEMVERTEPLLQQHSYLHVANFTNAVHFMTLAPSQESLERHWNAGVFGNFLVTIFAFLMPLLLLSDSLFEFETSESRCAIAGSEKFLRPSFLKRVSTFYSSNRTKYMLDVVYYLAFLALLSYVLMVDMPRSGISVSEAISIGFICCSSLDLLLEVSSLGLKLGIKECRQFVRTSPWVSFKAITYVVGWIYLALRISGLQAYIYIRTLLGFLLILCFLRLFELMAVSRVLGPYIVIMPQMLQQFAFFLVVILIVLMPFGIGVQVLMLPYQVYSDGLLFFKIFELPYYNLFGELQLDSIKGEKDNCPSDGINCPLQNPLAQIMHALYLLFAMVLLLNLLIAVSSAVYTELSSKAIDLWKFNQFAFLRMYKLKSAFPPPFSTVHIFLRFLNTAVKKFCLKSDRENGKRTDQGTQENSELQSRLSAVEGVCFGSVFAKFNQSPAQAVSASLARTSETLRRDVPELTREMYTWMRQLKQIEDAENVEESGTSDRKVDESILSEYVRSANEAISSNLMQLRCILDRS